MTSNASSTSNVLASHVTSMPFDNPPFRVEPVVFGSRYGLAIAAKTKPDLVTRLLPKPLVAVGNELIFQFNFNTIVAPTEAEYPNATVIVPVTLGDFGGLYFSRVYEGSSQATMLTIWGREIWGFPKVAAEVSVQRDGNVAKSRMRALNGCASADVEIEITDTTPVAQPESMLTIYCHKLIPSADGNGFDVNRLVEAPVENKPEHHQAARLVRCDITIDLAGEAIQVPIDEESTAFWYDQDAGSRLELGRSVHDYLVN